MEEPIESDWCRQPPLDDRANSVARLRPGQQAHVAMINGTGAIRQRLLDMGILPNVVIKVERVAPAGDPIWIKLDGYQLSLRRHEAASVVVASYNKSD